MCFGERVKLRCPVCKKRSWETRMLRLDGQLYPCHFAGNSSGTCEHPFIVYLRADRYCPDCTQEMIADGQDVPDPPPQPHHPTDTQGEYEPLISYDMSELITLEQTSELTLPGVSAAEERASREPETGARFGGVMNIPDNLVPFLPIATNESSVTDMQTDTEPVATPRPTTPNAQQSRVTTNSGTPLPPYWQAIVRTPPPNYGVQQIQDVDTSQAGTIMHQYVQDACPFYRLIHEVRNLADKAQLLYISPNLAFAAKNLEDFIQRFMENAIERWQRNVRQQDQPHDVADWLARIESDREQDLDLALVRCTEWARLIRDEFFHLTAESSTYVRQTIGEAFGREERRIQLRQGERSASHVRSLQELQPFHARDRVIIRTIQGRIAEDQTISAGWNAFPSQSRPHIPVRSREEIWMSIRNPDVGDPDASDPDAGNPDDHH